ncbi:MAG: TRAP transporter substrate-binding protein [Firmicutes bacterium]|nr:TRAP transporter substrate-binding protein [Bacillota bacterium]
MKKILAAILAAGMVLGLTACATTAAPAAPAAAPAASAEAAAPAETPADLPEVTLKFATVMGSATVQGKELNAMSERIAERTGGKFNVEVHLDGVLGSEAQGYESVDMGTLDMALVAIGTQSSTHPELVVEDLPFMFKTREDAYKAIDGDYGAAINDVIASDGTIRNLGFFEVGQRQITNSKKPIVEPADLEGLTIRVATSDLRLDVFNTLGAQAIAMDWNEVYSALQQGTVDGQECPLSVIDNSSLYDVQKYVSLSGHFWTNNCVLINEDSYQNLPDEYKAILEEEVKNSVANIREQNIKDDETLVETLKEKGMEVNEINKDAFVEKLAPLYDKWEEKVIGSTLMDAFRANSGY